MFIVQDSVTKQYSYYAKPNDFWTCYAMLDMQHYNEVIKPGPQKMRLDLESSTHTDDWDVLVHRCYEAIRLYIPNAKLLVYEMSDSSKYSCHIVCYNVMFDSNTACKALCHKVKAYINTDIIDTGVYGTTQHFRLEGSYKAYGKRRKLLTHTDANKFDYRHGLITCSYDCTHNHTSLPSTSIQTPNEAVDYVVLLDWCIPVVTKGSLLLMKRTKPSFCTRCQRIHNREHPYIVIVDSFTAYLNCRRSEGRQYMRIKGKVISMQ